ncbi:MAG: hypothetical protein ACLP0J_16560 [Solirubrobacteraceae bacterium]
MAGEAEMIFNMVAAVFDYCMACDDPRARQAVTGFAGKDATLRPISVINHSGLGVVDRRGPSQW